MGSPFPAFLGRRTDQLDRFGHFPADFFLENFTQRDVCHAEMCRIGNEWAAQAATTGIELPDAARDEVHQHIWVADLFGSLFAEFGIHNFRWKKRAQNYIRSANIRNKKN